MHRQEYENYKNNVQKNKKNPNAKVKKMPEGLARARAKREVYFWGELDKAIGGRLIEIQRSLEGYRILKFKMQDGRIVEVWIDYPTE
jgi:hypothetical protein